MNQKEIAVTAIFFAMLITYFGISIQVELDRIRTLLESRASREASKG